MAGGATLKRANALVFDFVARDRASRTFDRMSGKARSFGATLGRLARRALIAATAAGAAFAVRGVRGFMAFDDAMNESLAIMGNISGPMRKRMEAAAREMAKTTRFSADEVAEGYFFLASAGLDAEQSILALPQVTKFAQAGMFNLAKATELATDAQSALGWTVQEPTKNLENLSRVTDVLVHANTLANATTEQFAEAITNRAGPAMRAVNMDVEEGAAVLAAFADQGIKGRRAGQAFAIVLRELQRQALNNSEAFEEAGIQVFDASGNMRNMGQITKQLEARFDGMSDAQKRAELITLGFTDRSIQSILALMGTGDAIIRYEKELRNAAGTTETVADNQLQSFRARVDLLRSRIDDLAMSFGSVLVNAVFDAGEKLAPFGDKIVRILGEDIKPRIQAAWSEIGEILFGKRAMATTEEEMSGAKIGSGLAGQLTEAAKGWAQGMIDGLAAGASTGNFGPLGEAIGKGIADAIGRAADLAGMFFEWVGSVNWASVGVQAGRMLIPFGVGLLAGLIDGIFHPDTWRQIASQWHVILLAAVGIAFAPARIVAAIGRFLARIPIVGRMLSWMFTSFAKVSKAVIPAVLKFLGRIFGAFINGLTRGAAGRVASRFMNWLSLFPTAIGVAAINVGRAAQGLIQGLGNAIARGAGFIGRIIGNVVSWLTTPFRAAASWLAKPGTSVVKGLGSGISAAIRGITTAISAVIRVITAPFKAAGSWLIQTGRNLLRGLIDGITSRIKAIADVASTVLRAIVTPLQSAGSMLVSAGSTIIRGLISGISKMSRSVGTAVATVVRFLLTPFRAAGSWLSTTGVNLLKGLISGINTMIRGVMSVIDTVIRAVTWPFRTALTWLTKNGSAVIQGLISGIGAMLRAVANVVASVIRAVTWPFRTAASWLVKNGSSVISGLISGIGSMLRSLGSGISRVISAVTTPFRTAGRWLIDRGSQLISGLMNGISSIARGLRTFFTVQVHTRVMSFFSRAKDWLVNSGKNVLQGLLNGVSSLARTIHTWARTTIRQPVISFFSRAKDWLVSAGKNLLQGLKNGMLSLLARPVDFFRSIGSKIVSGVKSFFGIRSPSRVFAGLGTNLIQGFVKGMLTSGKGLRSLTGKVFGGMPSALAHLVAKGVIAVSKLPAKAMSALESLGSAASAAWNMIFGADGASPGPAPKGAFQFPLPSGRYRVGSPFGQRGSGFHSGWDFPASIGTPVFAPFAGRMSTADLGNRSYGKYANVYAGAWRFIAAHLSGFARGAGMVRRGDLLGFVGSTGRSTGPHLHAEFRQNGRAINPRNVLAFARGGLAKAGQWATVGEDGPELVRFPTQARVFNNRRSQEMSSPQISLHPHFTVTVMVGERDITDIVDIRIEESNRQMKNRLRAGTGRNR